MYLCEGWGENEVAGSLVRNTRQLPSSVYLEIWAEEIIWAGEMNLGLGSQLVSELNPCHTHKQPQ